jgi:hypothetical protein
MCTIKASTIIIIIINTIKILPFCFFLKQLLICLAVLRKWLRKPVSLTVLPKSSEVEGAWSLASAGGLFPVWLTGFNIMLLITERRIGMCR